MKFSLKNFFENPYFGAVIEIFARTYKNMYDGKFLQKF